MCYVVNDIKFGALHRLECLNWKIKIDGEWDELCSIMLCFIPL